MLKADVTMQEEASSRGRVSLEMGLHERRLQSLARVLQGPSECVAIAFVGRELLIAANELTKKSRDNQYIRAINDVMNYFKMIFADEKLPTANRIRFFTKICQLKYKTLKGSVQAPEKLIKLIVNHIVNGKQELSLLTLLTEYKEHAGAAGYLFGIFLRLYRDFFKVEAAVKTELAEVFRADYDILQTSAESGIHAEVQLLEHLLLKVLEKMERGSKDFGPMKNRGGNSVRGYIRHKVDSDGDCGYTAFGITRENALQLLTEHLATVRDVLQPAVHEALVTVSFYHYLIKNEAIATHVTFDDITTSPEKYMTDLNVQMCYLNYDVGDRNIDAGWAHPCVLQSLAHIQQIELRIWQLGERRILIPFRSPEYDYSVHTPTSVHGRANLLFINGNHFERLDLVGYENGVTSEPIYPLESSQSEDFELITFGISKLCCLHCGVMIEATNQILEEQGILVKFKFPGKHDINFQWKSPSLFQESFYRFIELTQSAAVSELEKVGHEVHSIPFQIGYLTAERVIQLSEQPRPQNVPMTPDISESDVELTVDQKILSLQDRLERQLSLLRDLPYENVTIDIKAVEIGLQLCKMDTFKELLDLEVVPTADLALKEIFGNILDELISGYQLIPKDDIESILLVCLKTQVFVGEKIADIFHNFTLDSSSAQPTKRKREVSPAASEESVSQAGLSSTSSVRFFRESKKPTLAEGESDQDIAPGHD